MKYCLREVTSEKRTVHIRDETVEIDLKGGNLFAVFTPSGEIDEKYPDIWADYSKRLCVELQEVLKIPVLVKAPGSDLTAYQVIRVAEPTAVPLPLGLLECPYCGAPLNSSDVLLFAHCRYCGQRSTEARFVDAYATMHREYEKLLEEKAERQSL